MTCKKKNEREKERERKGDFNIARSIIKGKTIITFKFRGETKSKKKKRFLIKAFCFLVYDSSATISWITCCLSSFSSDGISVLNEK